MLNLIIVVIVLLLMFAGYAYSKCKKALELTNQLFEILDTYLKERLELIPNLVGIYKQYAENEKDMIMEIEKLCNKKYDRLSREQKIDLNKDIGRHLAQLAGMVEKYPGIATSAGFQVLKEQILLIENKINGARKEYNSSVQYYNSLIKTAPASYIAQMCKLKAQIIFEDIDTSGNIKPSF